MRCNCAIKRVNGDWYPCSAITQSPEYTKEKEKLLSFINRSYYEAWQHIEVTLIMLKDYTNQVTTVMKMCKGRRKSKKKCVSNAIGGVKEGEYLERQSCI